jgi:type IV pilus biogenesis protein CpaD/CtpE
VRLATLLFRHALQHDHTQAGKFFCDGRHLAAQIIDPRHIGGERRVVGHDARRLHRRLDARAARDRFTTGNR